MYALMNPRPSVMFSHLDLNQNGTCEKVRERMFSGFKLRSESSVWIWLIDSQYWERLSKTLKK